MKNEIELCSHCKQPLQEENVKQRIFFFWRRDITVLGCVNEKCPDGRLRLAHDKWNEAMRMYVQETSEVSR